MISRSSASSAITWMRSDSSAARHFSRKTADADERRKVPTMSEQAGYCVQGGCLCGAVRFELIAPPRSSAYCHCTRCQRRTGTGSSVSAFIDPESLRWLQGESLIKGWLPATDGAEGVQRVQATSTRAAATTRASASGCPRSILIRGCEPARVSTWRTRPAGKRSPTTAYPATTKRGRPVWRSSPDASRRSPLLVAGT